MASIAKELRALAQLTAPCQQCTSCASACPVFQSDAARNPRRIIHELGSAVSPGILNEVDVWWCGGCYSCEAHCPQGVPLTHVLTQLKQLAFFLGKPVPEAIRRTAVSLKNGTLFPKNEEVLKKRKKLGLPDLEEADTEELVSILESTGFSKQLQDTTE